MFKALIALAMAVCGAGGFSLGFYVRGKKDRKEFDKEMNMVIGAKAEIEAPMEPIDFDEIRKVAGSIAEESAKVMIDAVKTSANLEHQKNITDVMADNQMVKEITKVHKYGNDTDGDHDFSKIPGWFDEVSSDSESPEDDDPDDITNDEDDIQYSGYSDDTRDEPYPITWRTYNNTRQYYDKLTIAFYKDDGKFINVDNGAEIDDPDRYFGDTEDLIRALEDMVEDIYIRYDPEGKDFAIHLEKGFFMNAPEEGE